MDKLILVAGATGNLGEKICRELIKNNAKVRAIVRESSSQKKITALEKMGVEIMKVDMNNKADLSNACKDVSCVVSALAGLHDVIADTQKTLLDAAVEAGVPRFIPSDFSTDFTQMPTNENRNFDLRKEFESYIDQTPIKATSVFNGCFAEVLRYNTPLYNVAEKTIAYYDGKEDWKIDFTTMDDTAAYTAKVALDETAPRHLRIASFSVSPKDFAGLSGFKLVHMGSMEDFSRYNKAQRAAHPEGEKELYAKWQQSQYMYSMFLVHHNSFDNNRYPELSWSPVEQNISLL